MPFLKEPVFLPRVAPLTLFAFLPTKFFCTFTFALFIFAVNSFACFETSDCLTPIVFLIGLFGLSNILFTFIDFFTLTLTGVVPFDFGLIFLSGTISPFFTLPAPENILSTFIGFFYIDFNWCCAFIWFFNIRF